MTTFFSHERLFKLFNVLVACGFMSSCIVSPPTQLDREIINALVIKNETSVALLNVTLRVPEKHKIVKTNKVLPRQEYSLGFQASRNERDYATLTWTHRNQTYTREINTYIPEDIESSVASRVVIRIGENGYLGSKIEPYPDE